jgi:hypothetical protein
MLSQFEQQCADRATQKAIEYAKQINHITARYSSASQRCELYLLVANAMMQLQTPDMSNIYRGGLCSLFNKVLHQCNPELEGMIVSNRPLFMFQYFPEIKTMFDYRQETFRFVDTFGKQIMIKADGYWFDINDTGHQERIDFMISCFRIAQRIAFFENN